MPPAAISPPPPASWAARLGRGQPTLWPVRLSGEVRVWPVTPQRPAERPGAPCQSCQPRFPHLWSERSPCAGCRGDPDSVPGARGTAAHGRLATGCPVPKLTLPPSPQQRSPVSCDSSAHRGGGRGDTGRRGWTCDEPSCCLPCACVRGWGRNVRSRPRHDGPGSVRSAWGPAGRPSSAACPDALGDGRRPGPPKSSSRVRRCLRLPWRRPCHQDERFLRRASGSGDPSDPEQTASFVKNHSENLQQNLSDTSDGKCVTPRILLFRITWFSGF